MKKKIRRVIKMKYNDFIKSVSEELKKDGEVQLSQRDLQIVQDAVFETVFKEVKENEQEVKIPRFGKFYQTLKRNVKVRNPMTGEFSMKDKLYRFNFTPFSSLKQRFYD